MLLGFLRFKVRCEIVLFLLYRIDFNVNYMIFLDIRVVNRFSVYMGRGFDSRF